MFDWMLFLGESRYDELLREREREILVRLALEQCEPSEPFYYEALAGLGRQLSAFGNQLQERYGTCETVEQAT
jgi:hypothetical protein